MQIVINREKMTVVNNSVSKTHRISSELSDFYSRSDFMILTRLALASVLGPFEVHCSTLQYISVLLSMIMEFIS